MKPTRWEDTKEGKEYRARRDMETLKEAAEVHADKERHKAAKKHANTELQKMSAIVHVINIPVIEKSKKISVDADKSNMVGDTKSPIKDKDGAVSTKNPGSDTKAATKESPPKKTTNFSTTSPANKQDGKPIKKSAENTGKMITKGPKPAPVKPSGSRLDQWMDKRNKTAKR